MPDNMMCSKTRVPHAIYTVGKVSPDEENSSQIFMDHEGYSWSIREAYPFRRLLEEVVTVEVPQALLS